MNVRLYVGLAAGYAAVKTLAITWGAQVAEQPAPRPMLVTERVAAVAVAVVSAPWLAPLQLCHDAYVAERALRGLGGPLRACGGRFDTFADAALAPLLTQDAADGRRSGTVQRP